MNGVIFKKKICMMLSVILLVVILLVYSIQPTYAATTCDGSVSSLYLGNERATWMSGVYDWSVLAYVYYDYNSTLALSVHSMSQTVANEGRIDVDEFRFQAYNIQGVMVDEYSYNDDSPSSVPYLSIAQGESARIEAPWHSVADSAYTKGTSNQAIVTKIVTKSSDAELNVSSWEVYWKPSSKIIEFFPS